jgi:hypothetical protein
MECRDCQGAIASKLAPARIHAVHKLEDDAKPVGAGLPAKRPAHSLQNSKHPTVSEAPFTELFDALTDKAVGIFTTASFRVNDRHPLVGFFLKRQ